MAEGMWHWVGAGQDSLRRMVVRSDSLTSSSEWVVTCIIIQMARRQYSRGSTSYTKSAFSKSSSTIAYQREELRESCGGPTRDEPKELCWKTMRRAQLRRKDRWLTCALVCCCGEFGVSKKKERRSASILILRVPRPHFIRRPRRAIGHRPLYTTP